MRPVAMRPSVVILALVVTVSMVSAGAARAQSQSMPQHNYSSRSAAQGYGLPEARQPATAKNQSANVVKIPIPGGGEITVEGPAKPIRNPLPPLGGDTWAVHQTAPNSNGTGPLGPGRE